MVCACFVPEALAQERVYVPACVRELVCFVLLAVFGVIAPFQRGSVGVADAVQDVALAEVYVRVDGVL